MQINQVVLTISKSFGLTIPKCRNFRSDGRLCFWQKTPPPRRAGRGCLMRVCCCGGRDGCQATSLRVGCSCLGASATDSTMVWMTGSSSGVVSAAAGSGARETLRDVVSGSSALSSRSSWPLDPDGLVLVEHFHKAVAFGAVGAAVIDDLDIADAANALEQLLQVLLGHLIGEIADVDAGRLDAGAVAAAGRALGRHFLLTFATALAILAACVAGVGFGGALRGLGERRFRPAAGRCRFLVEADGLEELLPPVEGRRLAAARRAGALRAEFLGAATGAALVLAAVAAVLLLVAVFAAA